MNERLRIGYIPLVDAAALTVAVDRGFCADEGLDVELVCEVSWSNVRDKLNVGIFDAAHLIAPIAIASSLGLGHLKVPIIAPVALGINGNAITVSPALQLELMQEAGGGITDPLATAQALARLVARRKASGGEPYTFGMTFPHSTHNYHLRFWMAAGGVDPDEDVRLVVLPPPYMVESLATRQVDGFCVGAPWNSIAVDQGVGNILHLMSEILSNAGEKVLGIRQSWAQEHSDVVNRLIRAHYRAAMYVDDPANLDEIGSLLSYRMNASPEVIRRTLEGRLKISPDGAIRVSDRYVHIGKHGALRPNPVHAAWLYAQMVRWRQTPFSEEMLKAARTVYRPDLFDAATGTTPTTTSSGPVDGVGAFTGPAFDADNVAKYLAAWR